MERTVVVKAILQEDRNASHPFAEISALCETAGAEVVEEIFQNVRRIHSATYLGKGKIEEISQRIVELDVELVVTDNDLSPAQERNLEKIFKCKVVDRSQLIMDIFAKRANSMQARLQVELAQLQYTFPRLKRMWGHLSRYEGGIGMRGPGETQLETDKRLIQRRIRILKDKLNQIGRRRELTLERRKKDLVIALVGYTNVGKSTLLNRLTGSSEFVENKLFATLDTRTRKWNIEGNRHVLLNDTVGFIRQLPHHLVASFHATLAETQYADLLFHVVDVSAPDARKQMCVVAEVLKKIDCSEKPEWVIFNKWDRLDEDQHVEARDLETSIPQDSPLFRVSAKSGLGMEKLRLAIGEFLDRNHKHVSLVLPHKRGDLLAFIRRNGKVLQQKYLIDGTHLEVEMNQAPLQKLRSLYPEGFDG